MPARVVKLSIAEICAAAKAASPELAGSPLTQRNVAIATFADLLAENAEQLIERGREDEVRAVAHEVQPIVLTNRRLARAQTALRVALLADDPVGVVCEERHIATGLRLQRRSVPLGVVGYLCLGRPEAIVEAIGVCLKSANALVLFGASVTAATDSLLVSLAVQAVQAAMLPEACVAAIPNPDDQALREFVCQSDSLDVIKQRGGKPMDGVLAGVATVPVLYAVRSNCHLYLDADAGPETALKVLLDSKTVEPELCYSIETLLVHTDVAPGLLARALRMLAYAGVTLRLDAGAAVLAESHGIAYQPAVEEDWEREYLSLTLAVRIVNCLEQAIEHIRRYGSGHSEAIVSRSSRAQRIFAQGVDAACVYINASTRHTTGPRLGLGPELGMSTQKMPLRGPLGLRELCTHTYVIEGNGHTP